MPEPVQIRVVVDPNGGVAGFEAITASGQDMGVKVITAAEAAAAALGKQTQATLTGADAVAVLTAQWERQQAETAAVNARMKETAAALNTTSQATRTVKSTFQDWNIGGWTS